MVIDLDSWPGWAAVAVAAAAPILSAVYMRGRLDAHGTSTAEKIESLRDDVKALAGQVNANQVQIVRATTQLDAHLVTCDKASDDVRESLVALDRKVEGGFENLRGQILNVAKGRTGKLYEVRTPRAKRARAGD